MTRLTTPLRTLRTDETGASLILVMALLMFVGLVTAAVLNYAQTSLGTASVLEERVAEDYDVDGAVQVGVNRIRTDRFVSEWRNGTLTEPPQPFLVAGSTGGTDVTVEFQAVPGTGATQDNIDAYDAFDSSPASQPGPASDIPERAVPACNATADPYVRFEPGLYTNGSALTSLMATCNKAFWFPGAPGGQAYFFDFRDANAANRVWVLNDADIRAVGGGTAPPTIPVAIPGSCTGPMADGTFNANDGVVFLLGGDSRLEVRNGQMELCGPAGNDPAGPPPIGLFGGDTRVAGTGVDYSLGPNSLPATPPPAASLTNGTLTMLNGTGANVGSDAAFGNNATQKNRIRPWDNTSASASLTNTNRRASVRVSGYAPSAASPADTVPAGANLTYAKAYVRHREQESGTASFRHVHLTVTPTGSSTPVGPVNVAGTSTPGLSPTNSSTYQRGEVNLLSTPALQNWVTDNGFTGAEVVWSVELGASGTENATMDLDSILIVLGWRESVDFRPQSGCVLDGSCRLVNVTGGEFYVQGAGNVPRSIVDLAPAQIKEPLFSWGLKADSQSVIPEDPIAVTHPRPLKMLVRAYKDCPSPPDPGCSADGSATATYRDPGNTVTAGNREVTIDTWWIRR